MTSADPPKSLTTAHCFAFEPSLKVTDLILIGVNFFHDAALYESQNVWPGTQYWPGGEEKFDVWPISQTNAAGASYTSPQASELPSSCLLNTGIIGPVVGL